MHIYNAISRSIIGGANIHTFVLTECKNNRFPKKLIKEKQAYEYPPPPPLIINLPVPVNIQTFASYADSNLFDKLESISKAGTSYSCYFKISENFSYLRCITPKQKKNKVQKI